MEAIGAIVALLVLFGIGVAVLLAVAAVKAGRAVAAKVERTEVQARRAVENVALKAKTYANPGAPGQIAAIRLGLRNTLAGTREVLEGALAADGTLAEALALLTRLDGHAAELDAELRMLEREPAAARVAAKLPELRERAERITRSAESMRWAAQDRMHRFAADELSRLAADCENEAGALRHWDTGAPSSGAPGDGASGGGASGGGASGGGASGGGASGGGAASTGAPSAGASQQPGLTTGAGRISAEELLGRFADRLRKPAPGASGAGGPSAR